MLLLTDDMDKSNVILEALQQIEPCRIIDLHNAIGLHPSHLMIVCHLSRTDDTTLTTLRAALEHHRLSRHVPLLFVISLDCTQSMDIAVQLGADDYIASGSDDAALRQAVRAVRLKVRARHLPTHYPARAENSKLARAGQSLTSIFDAARLNNVIQKRMLSDGAEAIVDLTKSVEVDVWVRMMRGYDNATYQHCLLVAGIMATFSRRLSLTLIQQHAMAQAALLHDIGKVGIALEILNKPFALTSSEKLMIEQHPAIGYNILVAQKFDDRQALSIVRHHHELLDGSGYPDKLRGSEISEKVRMTTICDIFAALIERRPYKSPQSAVAAMEKLVALGERLDTGLLKEFSSLAKTMRA